MLPSLTTINLGDTYNFSLSHLRHCSQLKYLSLYTIGARAVTRDFVAADISETRYPILESLKIKNDSAEAADELRKFLDLSQLRELRLRGRGKEIQNAATGIMECASQMLECFVWEQSFM